MEDQICPRCKTSKFGNPSMKLLVNVCGHPLCESCVDILFARGSAQCLECGAALRRGNFRAQLYEDPYVERELDIRRRVLKDYNKLESDFPTLRDYNDYLEEVETIIFNLANNLDVEETKKRIDNYRRVNKDVIARNRHRLGADEREILELLESEKVETESRRRELTEADRRERELKARLKDELFKDFLGSSKSTHEIMAKAHLKTAESEAAAAVKRDEVVKSKLTPPPGPNRGEIKLSSGLTAGISSLSTINRGEPPAGPPVLETFPPYAYKKPVVDWCGPAPPERVLREDGYPRLAVFEPTVTAGGFTPEVATLRALQEAVAGLFFFAPKGRKPPTLADPTAAPTALPTATPTATANVGPGGDV